MKKKILSMILISALACCITMTAVPSVVADTAPSDVIMNDFENWKPDFTTLRTGGDLWKIRRNSDKNYVTSGNYSLEVLAGGYYENSRPTVYFPMTSPMYGYNYDVSKFVNVVAKVFNAKSEPENMRIGINTKSAGKSMPTGYVLQPGWNSVVYTFNHNLIIMYNGTLEDIPSIYFEFDPAGSENEADSAHVYVDDLKLIAAQGEVEIMDIVELDPYEICDFEKLYQQYIIGWDVYQDTAPVATIVDERKGELPAGMTASHGFRCLKIETHVRADRWQAYPKLILRNFVVEKAVKALTEEEKAKAYICFDLFSPKYSWHFDTGFRDSVNGAASSLEPSTTQFWGPDVPAANKWKTVRYKLTDIDAPKSSSQGRFSAEFADNPESIYLSWADYFDGENRTFYLDNFRIEIDE